MGTNKVRQRHTGNSRGFSLLEVLLGISVFMIGMLGVTALNISSMKSNTFSGNLSEATLIAASKIEELMSLEFDHADLSDKDDDGNGTTDRDTDDDGVDDRGTGFNFGLDDVGEDADYYPGSTATTATTVSKNNITYNIYWNVAENEPISVDPQRCKRVNVIVEWEIKDEPRRISMSTIIQRES